MRARRYIGSDGKHKIQCFNGRSYDFFDENGGELFFIKQDGNPAYIGGHTQKNGGGSWLSLLLLAPFAIGALIYR